MTLSLYLIYTESIILLHWYVCTHTWHMENTSSGVTPFFLADEADFQFLGHVWPVWEVDPWHFFCQFFLVECVSYWLISLSYSYNCWYEKPIHVFLMDQWFRGYKISPPRSGIPQWVENWFCSGHFDWEVQPSQLCTTFVAEYLGVATWLLIHISMFHGYIPSFLMVKFKLQVQSTFLLVQSVKSESLNIFDVCQVSKYCRLYSTSFVAELTIFATRTWTWTNLRSSVPSWQLWRRHRLDELINQRVFWP